SQDRDPRIGPASPRFETCDPRRDPRKGKATDRANYIPPGPPLLHQPTQITGQVARLPDSDVLPLNISRLALEQGILVRENKAHPRKLAGGSLDLGRHGEACVHQAVLLSAECIELVRHTPLRVDLHDATLDREMPDGANEAQVLESSEIARARPH